MPTTLARLLVEAGLASQEAADEALRRHVAVGGSLDTVLLEDRVLDEAKILEALGAASGLPTALPEAYAALDPKILVVFPYKLADRYGMVPIAAGKRHVDVAVGYPVEKLLLEEISFMLGKDLRPMVSIEVRIRAAIATHYKKPLAARFSNLLRALESPPKPASSARSVSVATSTSPPLNSARPPTGKPPPPPMESVVAPSPPPVEVGPVEVQDAAQLEVELVVEPEVLTGPRPVATPLNPSSPFAAVTIEVEQPLPAPKLSWAEEGPSPFEMDAPAEEEDVRVEDDAAASANGGSPWEPPLPPASPPVSKVSPALLAAASALWEAPPSPKPPPMRGPATPIAPLATPPPGPPLAVYPDPPSYPEPPPFPKAPPPFPEPPSYPEPPPFPEPPTLDGYGAEEEDVRVNPEPEAAPAPVLSESPASPPPPPEIRTEPVLPAAPVAAVATEPAIQVAPPPVVAEVSASPSSTAVSAEPSSLKPETVAPQPESAGSTPEVVAPKPEAVAPTEEMAWASDEDVVHAPVVPPPLPKARPKTLAPMPAPPSPESVSAPPAPPPPEPESAPVLSLARPLTPISVSVPTLAPPDADASRRKLGAETMERMLSWDATSHSLGSIESALASADLAEIAQQIYGDDERPFRVAPTDVPPPPPSPNNARVLSGEAPSVAPEVVRPLQWSLTIARQRLAEAPGRDEIIEVALRFALKSFEFAAALAVRAGTAFGWHALGSDDAVEEKLHQLALPLDAPSVLRTVLRARGRYLGPLPDDELTRKLLADLGREAPAVALIYPVFVRERVVAFFYADRGSRHVAAARVAEFLLFAQEISTAFERAILNNKRRSGVVRAVAVAPFLTSSMPAQAQEGALTVNSASSALSTPHRGEPAVRPASDEVFFDIDENPIEVAKGPPRQITAVIDDLISPDRRRRITALSELAANPEASAKALAGRFPGPTAMRRGLVDDLPEPEEIGPVANALFRMGLAAVPHLVELLREGDPDTRFFAVLLVGWMKSGELLRGLLTCLFDPVLEVAAAARSAAQRLSGLADFEVRVARPLRAELGHADPDRVCSAAKALGRVRDVASVGLLIPLTGHADDRVVAEAADALTLLTKQVLGDSPRRWQTWYEANLKRPRNAWLVDGLGHKDIQVRLSSVEELVHLTNDNFGYFADGPKREREKAIARWAEWLQSRV